MWEVDNIFNVNTKLNSALKFCSENVLKFRRHLRKISQIFIFPTLHIPGPEVIKRCSNLRLRLKHVDWLILSVCSGSTNQLARV